MKLKDGLVLHSVGDEHMMVATGEAGKNFNGLVRNNQTAQEILTLLQKDTTEEAVVDAMLEKYEASREVIERDVQKILLKLRELGFLDE